MGYKKKKKTESLNMERDYGKLWKLTNSLNDNNQESFKPTLLKDNEELLTGEKAANKLAGHFEKNSELNISREKSADIRRKIKFEQSNQKPSNCMTENFTMEEPICKKI